jgi:NAD(P)-dependent dehydrogenase (short-subunit alcohol dehydrogenase family)
MNKTLIVCGYGPGISTAVAEKFGAEGFTVALVARNAERLNAGVKALQSKNIKAAAFPADLSKPAEGAAVVGKVRAALSPITVVHWNAYSRAAGDLLAGDPAELRGALDIATTSLLAVVKEALPDLRQTDRAAILVTNGGFFVSNPTVDKMGVQGNAMGLSIANAAKHKLVGLLSEKLKGDRIFVAEVAVMGTVKGSAFDRGDASLEGRTIAETFWSLYRARSDIRAQVSM